MGFDRMGIARDSRPKRGNEQGLELAAANKQNKRRPGGNEA
jgi:hypothetical protein